MEKNNLFADLGLDLNLEPTQNTPPPSSVLQPGMPQVNMGGDFLQTPSSKANAQIDLNEDPSKRLHYNKNRTSQEIIALGQQASMKLKTMGQELSQEFFERDEVLNDMLRALIIGEHILLLGPPGTAKSQMSRAVCARITGANFFQWLLNRTSDPSEVLGPYSIKAMEKDMFLRNSKGKLPDAHIAFVDEIYKANEPMLNILLPILNERIFFNNGEAKEIPLVSMIAASNEMPQDEEELSALHDRLLFRVWVDYIKDNSNRENMHISYIQARNNSKPSMTKTTISLDELEALRYAACYVTFPKSVLKEFNSLLNHLSNKENIKISDRRQNACLKAMQGNALLNGRTQVMIDDLEALCSILWERKEDIENISIEIAKRANPYDATYKDAKAKFAEVKAKINSSSEKTGAIVETKKALDILIKKLATDIKKANSSGKDVSKLTVLREEIINYNQTIFQDALGLDIEI